METDSDAEPLMHTQNVHRAEIADMREMQGEALSPAPPGVAETEGAVASRSGGAGVWVLENRTNRRGGPRNGTTTPPCARRPWWWL